MENKKSCIYYISLKTWDLQKKKQGSLMQVTWRTCVDFDMYFWVSFPMKLWNEHEGYKWWLYLRFDLEKRWKWRLFNPRSDSEFAVICLMAQCRWGAADLNMNPKIQIHQNSHDLGLFYQLVNKLWRHLLTLSVCVCVCMCVWRLKSPRAALTVTGSC